MLIFILLQGKYFRKYSTLPEYEEREEREEREEEENGGERREKSEE